MRRHNLRWAAKRNPELWIGTMSSRNFSLKEIQTAVKQAVQIEVGRINDRIGNLENIEHRFDKQIDRISDQLGQRFEENVKLLNQTMNRLVDVQAKVTEKMEVQEKKTASVESDAKVIKGSGTALGVVFAAVVAILSYSVINSSAREREKVDTQFSAVNEKVALYLAL